MKNKAWWIGLMSLGILAQWWVPGQMIWQQEMLFSEGKAFKFKTAPVDPYDPFRGKYIWLDFEAADFEMAEPAAFVYDEQVYVSIENDSLGFARISAVTRAEPLDTEHYFKANVSTSSNRNSKSIGLRFPFGNFYMEESKAYEAEVLHREAARDTASVTYALVFIKNGRAGLANVFVDDVPIRDVVLRNRP